VPESKKADATLRQLQLQSIHLAMVVDEYGGIAGLVTMEDLIEELIGDISDEYDREAAEIEQIGAHRYRVAARLPIDDLEEIFGIELEEEDVDSVGGLLTKHFGRLPVRGSTVEVDGLVLTAERTERRRMTTVLVEATPALVTAMESLAADLADAKETRDRERDAREARDARDARDTGPTPIVRGASASKKGPGAASATGASAKKGEHV
jgi:Mg2+/Co2+ transporter CorC